MASIKKNSDHPIVVVYNDQTISNANDIIAIKKEIKETSKYEIVFDYDNEGFINKVTIINY